METKRSGDSKLTNADWIRTPTPVRNEVEIKPEVKSKRKETEVLRKSGRFETYCIPPNESFRFWSFLANTVELLTATIQVWWGGKENREQVHKYEKIKMTCIEADGATKLLLSVISKIIVPRNKSEGN
ncbi:hypothetical protein NC653_031026 [Populus alba x Populus x berolinensis]|uniref:Uncharacterized protein n=1 Tax=Populus alba x Populus x berolinensis TaxID=444605 RepID=A0AAD6LXD1_9ROSI|nr:hypothetical protein NC653_031026 [Populus alba x Populus x berolinensis]